MLERVVSQLVITLLVLLLLTLSVSTLSDRIVRSSSTGKVQIVITLHK